MTLLSHYTNRAGLEGIAKCRAFWATNFLDLKDNSEFFYAWLILQRDAMDALMKQIPDDLKAPGYNVEDGAARATTAFKEHMRNDPQGYGHLYVVSFARGKTEDHDCRGILSLWRYYTMRAIRSSRCATHAATRQLESQLRDCGIARGPLRR